jgi:Fe-S cluster assembly protein SufD
LDKKVITCHVGQDERFVHSIIIDAESNEKNIHISFVLERNSYLEVELLVAHTYANISLECVLKGEGAHAIIRGAYSVNESHNVVFNTVQHHQAPYTTSSLVMKGVLYDYAHVSYRGMIRVEKEARHSVSRQENKNIVLSNHAHALSVPSLEVLTNDVHCFHGSALGRFEADQLFYAASRGLDEKKAQSLLLKAFFADLLHGEKMKNYLDTLVR